MNKTFEHVREDLHNATLKEIIECLRRINASLDVHLGTKGRKDELITRFAEFLKGLVKTHQVDLVHKVIGIVKDNTHGKVFWRYANNQVELVKHVPPKKETSFHGELTFMPSPFFLPVAKLCSVKICEASSITRQIKRFQFTLDDNTRHLLATPHTVDDRPPYQVRFYCAKYAGVTTDLSVEFPAICELKVNDTTLPNNALRCLKGKPGTVNPPDITIMIHKKECNTIDLVYINNSAPFIATAYLVKRTTVSELISVMKEKHVLPKEQVLEKLQQMQEEDEIIMESETLSTKDPLVFTRIITPIRSTSCNHLQCFDATIYLTMNEQTPTWTCPVCYKRIDSWKDLFIDEYFKEILANTPKHIKSVLVEPSGNITIIDENPDLANEDDDEDEEEELHKPEEKEVITILLDDDDDEDEVGEEEAAPVRSANNTRLQTPPLPQQEDRSIPIVQATTTLKRKTSPESDSPSENKKPKASVIDLTLDSDNDEEDQSQENSTIDTETFDNTNDNENNTPITLIQEKAPLTEDNQQPTSYLNVYKFS